MRDKDKFIPPVLLQRKIALEKLSEERLSKKNTPLEEPVTKEPVAPNGPEKNKAPKQKPYESKIIEKESPKKLQQEHLPPQEILAATTTPKIPDKSTPESPKAISSTIDEGRREFLFLTTGAIGVLGATAALWPLLDSMNPSEDTLAEATVDVDLSKIAVGESRTVVWQGKPIFIRHRTPQEIEVAQTKSLDSLKDPEPDSSRTEKPEWLVVIGVCTHLGCIPLGQKASDPRGEYGGWLCPCHGSQFDTAGRVCKGPAPTNLEIPPYRFLNDTTLQIGAQK